jgi:hypothetical protein
MSASAVEGGGLSTLKRVGEYGVGSVWTVPVSRLSGVVPFAISNGTPSLVTCGGLALEDAVPCEPPPVGSIQSE